MHRDDGTPTGAVFIPFAYYEASGLGRKPTATNARFRVGQFHEKGVHFTALRRNPLMSRLGVTPKRRLYSRLNCEGLS